jgi:hypothetical protein
MCSHCLFPVVDNSGTSCYHLVTRFITVTNLLQVVPTRLIQAVRNKLLRACCHQLVNNSQHADEIRLVGTTCCESVGLVNLVARWQTACSRLVSNWKQAVWTHLVDRLWDFYAFTYFKLANKPIQSQDCASSYTFCIAINCSWANKPSISCVFALLVPSCQQLWNTELLKCIWHEISYFLKWKNSFSCSVTYFSVSCFCGLFPRYFNLFDM